MLGSILGQTIKGEMRKISMAKEVTGAKELEHRAIEMLSICIAF